MEIVGSFDNNIKELEKISGSKIFFRGNSITIKGNKNTNERVKNAIQYLIDRFKSDKKIDKNDIITSLNNEMIEETKNMGSGGRRGTFVGTVNYLAPEMVRD